MVRAARLRHQDLALRINLQLTNNSTTGSHGHLPPLPANCGVLLGFLPLRMSAGSVASGHGDADEVFQAARAFRD
jgi:hypothetical protein